MRRCVVVLALACFISTSSAQTKINPNFKMPKNIKSYSQYLKYMGMATGVLPIEPFAEDAFAPAPSEGKSILQTWFCKGSSHMTPTDNLRLRG